MMTLLTQKAKEDLEVVNMICSNLHSIIILKNRNIHVPLDHFVNKKGDNDYFSIPKNTVKTSYKTILFFYFNNLTSLISKKIKILFHR